MVVSVLKPTSSPRTAWYWLRRLLIHAASTLALLAAVEGIAFLMMRNEQVPPPERTVRRNVAERQHTRYDELLGWVNVPNTVLSNMYGEGRHVHINNLGFRGTTPIDPEQPAAARRVILSGDSFTFGYGVGDGQTWGAGLARREPGLEVLNMGLGGYGLGQAYLWYRREGDPLPHDLHIFSFITENFRRMTRSRFMGYGKPVLTAREGQLVVENVPPPQPAAAAPGPAPRWLETAQNLNIVRLINAQLAQVRQQQSDRWQRNAEETAALIFTELFALHKKAGRTGVLVYLPVQRDHRTSDSDRWRSWLAGKAEENGWAFIDLVRDLRRLPREKIDGLFIGQRSPYSGARGHYTEAGNEWVAETLHQHLHQRPELAAHLDTLAQADSQR